VGPTIRRGEQGSAKKVDPLDPTHSDAGREKGKIEGMNEEKRAKANFLLLKRKKN